MVLSPAPKPRRHDAKTRSEPMRDHWTAGFCKANVSRTRRKALIWTLSTCALVSPAGLYTRSQADDLSPASPNSPSQPALPSPSLSSSQPSSQSPSQPAPTSPVSSLVANWNSESPSESSRETASPAPAPAGSTLPTASAVAVEPIAALPATPVVVATPVQTLRFSAIADGQTRQKTLPVTPQMTVGGALAAMGISLSALDRVAPEASTPAKDGQTVRVTRVSAQTQTRTVAIPATLRYQPTPTLPAGTKKITQYPQMGSLEITERIWKRDGKTTKTEVVSKRIVRAPKDKIIALGTRAHLMPGQVNYHRRYARAYSVEAARGGSPRRPGAGRR